MWETIDIIFFGLVAGAAVLLILFLGLFIVVPAIADISELIRKLIHK